MAGILHECEYSGVFHFRKIRWLVLVWNQPNRLHGRFLKRAAWPHGRLYAMEQPVASAVSPASPSFASLLAALAAPAQRPGWNSAPAWNDDGLEDDVAILSYERALRAHARYGPSVSTDQPLAQSVDRELIPPEEPSPAHLSAGPQPAPRPIADPHMQPDRLQAAPPEKNLEKNPARNLARNLKDASITIRMSKEEWAQLHRRAAEAGITVSGYLRSCTFEVESLRAQVKAALAELRAAKAPAEPSDPAPLPRSRLRRLLRLLIPWRGTSRVARA